MREKMNPSWAVQAINNQQPHITSLIFRIARILAAYRSQAEHGHTRSICEYPLLYVTFAATSSN